MKKRPQICLSLNCSSIEEIKSEIDTFKEYCQMVEWCGEKTAGIEKYTAEELAQVIKLIRTMCKGKTLIFDYKGDDEELTNELLRRVMGLVDIIDIDAGNSQLHRLVKEAKKKRTKTLISYHEFDKILKGDEVALQFLKMEKSQGDILKVASFANSEEEAYGVLEGASAYNQLKKHKPFAAIAMGEEGQASRICAGDFGSSITYACGTKPTAPGQFNARDLSKYLDAYYK